MSGETQRSDRLDPAGRVLRLLSLLQTHRRWSSFELAGELDVTERTVRRDVERLRSLGYPVDSSPGVDGGYRLAAGAHLPPLMFDDDEAVALAVGLWSASSAPIEGIDDTGVRALAKIEQLLPDRLRRRIGAITANVSTYRWPGDTTGRVDMETVSTVSAACRDLEELRFSYVSKAGDETDRLVEPHRMVAVDQRWYLLAWDRRRDDWRTFRLDRMAAARLGGVRFAARDIPGGDPGAFVAKNLSGTPKPVKCTVAITASHGELQEAAPWFADRATREGSTLLIDLRAADPAHMAAMIAQLAMSFPVAMKGEGPHHGATLDVLARIAGNLRLA